MYGPRSVGATEASQQESTRPERCLGGLSQPLLVPTVPRLVLSCARRWFLAARGDTRFIFRKGRGSQRRDPRYRVYRQKALISLGFGQIGFVSYFV